MKITSKNMNQILPLLVGCFSLCCLVLISYAQMPEAGQDKFPPGDDKNLRIIATVNNQKITVSDFKKEMIKQGGLSGKRLPNMDEKMKVIEGMIRFELFFSEALKAGYDKDPEIVQSLKNRMVQKYLQENIEPKLQNTEVTEEEIKNYYQEHMDEYQKPPLAKIAVIWIKTPDKISPKERQRLKKKAEEALTEAGKENLADNSFGGIAKKYSDDITTKYKGGVIGWVSANEEGRKDIPSKVFKAGLSLKKVGQISPVITGPQGFYIVKLLKKKIFQPVTLKQAEQEIRYRLYAEKKRALYNNYYTRMKEKADISINQDLLHSLKALDIEPNDDMHRPPSFPLDIK